MFEEVDMKRPGILAGIIPLAVCIPCLIPVLLAAGIGAGAFSAFGSWFTDNSFVLAAGAVVAVAFSLLAWAVYVRRRSAIACATGLAPAASGESPRRTCEVVGSPGGEPRT